MAVLYRKYRPQTFFEVLNQKYIIQTLRNQVINSVVAHAYLFTGSRGVGKTSVARILAKSLNCKDKIDGDACGKCDVCKQIEAGNFIDLVEIDAASNTGVDNIRELIEHVKFAPSMGKYKVFIIDEVHMLSKGAFNALLKTLEEPPKHAVFILATTEINKVPPTIISRTQRFDFKALSQKDLVEHLGKIAKEEKIDLAPEILELVAAASEGSVRDSLSLLGKVLTLGSSASLADAEQLLGITDISICMNLFELIAQGQAKELPAFFEMLLEKSPDFKILNRDFLEFLRKVLVYKVSGSEENLPAEVLEKIKITSGSVTSNDVMFYIRLFLRSFKDLEFSPNPEMPLLLASLEAAFKKTQVTSNPASVIAKITPQPKISSSSNEDSNLNTQSAAQVLVQTEEVSLSFEEVQTYWPKVIAQIKQINGPLSSVLRKAQVLQPEGARVVLGVKFLFDKQSIESSKNLGLINETVKTIFGKNVGVRAEVIKEDKEALIAPAEAFSQALQVFGGELVE